MNPDFPAAIHPVTLSDIPALAKLATATFIETFGHLYAPEDLNAFISNARSEHAYHRLLKDPTVRIWLATSQDADPIGYAVAGSCKLPVVNLEKNAGEIRELYVRAAFQQHQLGTRLLSAALEWLNLQNRKPLYVGVWSENLGAQRLYGRFGFQKVAEYDFPVGRQIDREFILKQPLLGRLPSK